ncbi:MAG: carbohydrate ABC transporter permease [Clostridiales bacterium]|jgi:multiple sugar transport system permease protein|nr:carbohydrate ABC transporter permease [Clostridiales bacterium]
MRWMKHAFIKILFGFYAAFILLPVVFMFMNSLMPSWIMTPAYVNGQTTRLAFIPMPITLSQYKEALLLDSQLLDAFWNDLTWSIVSASCQALFALAAGYVLAKVCFIGRRLILVLFIFTMLMPLQVLIVPQYVIAQQFNIINTRWSLYLPIVFAPFGSFLMCQMIAQLPEEMIEYARLEGAGTSTILYQIVMPYALPGLWLVFVFTFAEAWNMIEQPLILLRDSIQYPLSLLIHIQGQFLPQYVLVAALIMMAPILSFLLFMRKGELGGLINL